MHKQRLLASFLILSLFTMICPAPSQGGGFQINMLNTKSTGMAGASTALYQDGSSVFFNPGAMSFLEYKQISLGTSVTIPSVSYLSPYTGNSDSESQIYAPIHFYAAGKLNEKTAIGISINTPFKQKSKWSDDWTGRYVTIESRLSTLYIQPSVSYAFSEKFSVGGGPVIGFGNTYFTRDLPVASQSGDIRLELDGSSVGFGFNIGIFYKANENFSAGIDFRSCVNMNVNNGDATLSNIPASLINTYPSSTSFETSYKLPSVISGGIAFKLTRELLICADINVTMWSVYDSLSYEFSDNTQLNYGSGKFYKDAFAIRLGAQYTISDKVAVRGGIALDNSPVQDEYVSPENPDADRFMFSLGGSVKLSEKMSLDLAYMLQNIKEREVSNPETNFGGNYKTLLNIAGVTLNYHF